MHAPAAAPVIPAAVRRQRADGRRRELAASLALTRPDSPVRAPILAHLAAIDAELTARAAARPGGPPGPAAA